MEEKVFFQGELGKICGILSSVDKTKEIVIIIHGFSTNKETGASFFAAELAKVNVNSLRIDLDNQGESELDFQTGISIPNYIKQVEAAINYCKKLGYKEISLIGTSYGALVVFGVVMSHPEIKRIILRVPVVDYKEHAIWLYGEDKVNEFKRKGYMSYYNKHNTEFNVTFDFIEKSYPYSMYEHAKKIQIPTLIIQGDKDDQVECKAAERVVSLFPNAKLHIIKGAGHNLSVNGDFSHNHKLLRDFFSNKD